MDTNYNVQLSDLVLCESNSTEYITFKMPGEFIIFIHILRHRDGANLW